MKELEYKEKIVAEIQSINNTALLKSVYRFIMALRKKWHI